MFITLSRSEKLNLSPSLQCVSVSKYTHDPVHHYIQTLYTIYMYVCMYVCMYVYFHLLYFVPLKRLEIDTFLFVFISCVIHFLCDSFPL